MFIQACFFLEGPNLTNSFLTPRANVYISKVYIVPVRWVVVGLFPYLSRYSVGKLRIGMSMEFSPLYTVKKV